jgi:release factor glutamine methyltransferase
MTDGMVSWRQLAADAERRLSGAGVGDSPAVDVRRIVERASGNEGAAYVLGLDDAATERGVHHFDVMIERRLTGEPLQYVIGHWGFRTLDLFIDSRVLIPRPETEVVAGLAIDELDRLRNLSVEDAGNLVAVDLGTGSGAIGLSMAVERDRVDVVLTDRSPDALAVARANLAGIGRAATRVLISEGSWYDALDESMRASIDVIASNPPYVATGDAIDASVRDWEPADALFAGEDGLDDIRVIVDGSVSWLRPNGSLVLETAPDQVRVVAALALAAGFSDVTTHTELRGVVARR